MKGIAIVQHNYPFLVAKVVIGIVRSAKLPDLVWASYEGPQNLLVKQHLILFVKLIDRPFALV